jgi:hypothetical protein
MFGLFGLHLSGEYGQFTAKVLTLEGMYANVHIQFPKRIIVSKCRRFLPILTCALSLPCGRYI